MNNNTRSPHNKSTSRSRFDEDLLYIVNHVDSAVNDQVRKIPGMGHDDNWFNSGLTTRYATIFYSKNEIVEDITSDFAIVYYYKGGSHLKINFYFVIIDNYGSNVSKYDIEKVIETMASIAVKGIPQLTNDITNSLTGITEDVVIDDRYILHIAKTNIRFGNPNSDLHKAGNRCAGPFGCFASALIVEIMFDVIDEHAYRPPLGENIAGEKYEEAKARFEKRK